MFFDEPGPERKSQKPRLRLADASDVPVESARQRLAAAKLRRESDGPSLLDRIDAIGRVAAELEPEQQPPVVSAPEPVREHRQEPASNIQDDPVAGQQTAPEPFWRDQDAHVANSNAPLIDPLFVIDAVRRFKYLIVATTILGGVIGTGVALTTPKLYSSAAQIIIDPRNNKVVENDITPDVFLSEAALAIVDSQVGIMRSPVVMDKVAAKLGLDKDIEFNGAKTGFLSMVKQLIGLSSQKASDGSRMGMAIRNVNEKTDIDRQQGTFIVNVGVRSEDPEKAALIANTIVDVYMEERATGRSATAGKAADALGSRLPELKKQVENAENAVAQFKAENDLFDAQGRQIDDDSIVRLNEQLNAARINTVGLNAKATTAKSLTADAVASGDLPEEINSGPLGTLRGRYTQALQRVQGLEAKLGPMHPDLKQAQGEAASLKTSIDQEIRRIRASIQTELKRAVQTEQQLAANLAQLKAKMADSAGPMVDLRELERTAASARQVYEQFLVRAQETSEQASIDSTNVTKTNPAKASDESEGTSKKVLAIGGFVGGFLFGLGLAILKGIWDALALRFGGQSPQPSQAPNPSGPVSPSGSGRRFVRGSFQPAAASRAPVNAPAVAFAENANPVVTATSDDKSNAMYPYPPVMPSPYAQPQGWALPAQQPMPYGMQPMLHPHMMQPQMMPMMQQAPVWYPQSHFSQPMMHPQMMPQPVIVHNYPAQPQPVQSAPAPVAVTPAPVREVEQPRPPVVAEAKVETIAPRPHRPLPTNADIDDIRDQLADMRAELMDLARQRRRA